MNRREFTRYATGASLAAELLAYPLGANAQIATILNYLMLSNPLLAIVSLIEWVWDYSSGVDRQAKTTQGLDKLDVISNQIGDITRNQASILKALADQEIAMKQALQRAFLDNDVRELMSIVQQFKVALASGVGTKTEKLSFITNRLEDVAFKLPLYGPAAAPAYIAAIALHNSVYSAMGASTSEFRVINETHHQNLQRILAGGADDEASLPYLITHDADGSQKTLFDFERRYAFAIVSVVYEGEGKPGSSYVIGRQYDGFSNGRPTLTMFWEEEIPGSYRGVRNCRPSNIFGRRKVAAELWFGPIKSQNHATLPGMAIEASDGQFASEPLVIDSSDRLTFTPSGSKLFEQQSGRLAAYYHSLYPGNSVDISRQLPIRPITSAQANLQQFVQTGLNQVERIMRATSGHV
jgi:hypothetical protein